MLSLTGFAPSAFLLFVANLGESFSFMLVVAHRNLFHLLVPDSAACS